MDPLALQDFKQKLKTEAFLSKLGLDYDIRGDQALLLCVVHDEKTPSLRVNLSDGMFKCFGCDFKGGDLIKFVMDYRQLGFVQSLEFLSTLLDIPLPESVAEIDKLDLMQRKLVRIRSNYVATKNLTNNSDIYEYLLSLCAEGPAIDYLKSRGIVDAEMVVKGFRIRVVDDYDKIGAAMLARFDERRLVAAGIMNDRRNLVFFNHRLLFPFFDYEEIVYVSARAMNNDVKPKYLNLRGVPIPTFYNVNAAYSGDFVFVAEGLTDTLSVAALGVPVVGIAGATNINTEKLLLLNDHRVVLGMDNDEAGQTGQGKVMEVLRQLALSVEVYDKKEKDMNEHLQTAENRQKLVDLYRSVSQRSKVGS